MPTYIFHITHIDNFPSIIQNGCIYSDKKKIAKSLTCVNIAHQSLKARRSVTSVPLPPNGTLDEYVPFYFAPRSPMLYAINNNQVQGYTGGQNPIVHLVSTVDAVVQAGLPFVFYDGHPVMWFSHAYNTLADLHKIDWNVMKSKYWYDTDQYPDRKRKRMAEFLVHDQFPLPLVQEIGVMDTAMVTRVTALVGTLQPIPVVNVRRNWYY